MKRRSRSSPALFFMGPFRHVDRYGASTLRIFAIYEPFRVGGGGFVVRSISMNKNGKITPTHQPEALIKWGY